MVLFINAQKDIHDGTIYDDPVEGSYEALEKLSSQYTLLLCIPQKPKPDRGLNQRSNWN